MRKKLNHIIRKRIKFTLSQNESELSKYFSQLIVFSRLRKIEDLTIKITEDMPITYDIETDYLYKKGEKIGVEKGMEKGIEQGRSEAAYENKLNFVISLLRNTDFSTDKIALLVGVDKVFVEKVVADLGKESQ